MIWLAVVGGFLAGLVLPVQTGVNAQLRLRVGHPILAALISFTVGTIALALYILALRLPWPSQSQFAATEWWNWVGGALGALYVAATISLAPRLGAAALVGTIITGQVVSSLILDNFGLFGYDLHPLSVGRVAGAALLIAGVVLIRRPPATAEKTDEPKAGAATWLYIAGGLLCGAAQPMQAGMNSTLGRHIDQPLLAALVSFVVGTLVLVVYCLILRVPLPRLSYIRHAPLWNWTGGLLGAIYVTTITILAVELSAATLAGLLIAGQMLASLVLDHYGWLGFRKEPVHTWRLIGALLLLVGVALTRLF